MASGERVNPVYRSISRPLTILGAERKLFFFAMCVGAGTFNLLGSLLGGVLMFVLLYSVARWATKTDPQILRFLLSSPRLRAQYDPSKFSPIAVRRIPMLKLKRIFKNYEETGSLNEQVNLYGFVDSHMFLTK